MPTIERRGNGFTIKGKNAEVMATLHLLCEANPRMTVKEFIEKYRDELGKMPISER